MSKKRSLESPVEIRNEIDGEWMNRNFKINDEWFWLPESLLEMTCKLTREMLLDQSTVDGLKQKSHYRINVCNGKIFNVKIQHEISAFNTLTYLQVNLTFHGKTRLYNVHSIVCLIANGLRPSAIRTVDHIDRNPVNNSPCNLRFASPSEQIANRTLKKRQRRIPLDATFDESKYVKVTRYMKQSEIVQFKPTTRTRSIHLCKQGTHVVINGAYTLRPHLRVQRYPCIAINNSQNSLHRLIYINAHDCESIRVIDHIDNDPSNWSLDNLRECSRAENVRAAHREQNATKNNCEVKVLNTATGETLEFRTKMMCKDSLKMTKHQYTCHMKVGSQVGPYKFIHVGSTKKKGSKHTVVCNGKRFYSLQECAEYIQSFTPEINVGSIVRCINKYRRMGKTYKGFNITYERHVDEFETT